MLLRTSSYCMASAEAPAKAITDRASISSSSSCPSINRRCSFASAKSVWAFPAWMTACVKLVIHRAHHYQPALQPSLTKFHVSMPSIHLILPAIHQSTQMLHSSIHLLLSKTRHLPRATH